MKVIILKNIEANTPLAGLFNAYMGGLSTVEIFSTPRESMRVCRLGFAGRLPQPEPLADAARRYYELTVLGNSLHHLHWCIEQANVVLADFYTTHNGDLVAYAKHNRRRSLEQFGGGDDEDWLPDPTAPDGWAVADTDCPARLAHHNLHAELGRFFANEESHGEYIGTSHAIDYHHFTVLVERQTEFAARKMFAAAGVGSLPMYAPNEAGEMVELPVIDLIEREINEDLANERLVDLFCGVFKATQAAADYYAAMPPDEPTGYAVLREVLGAVLAVKMAAWPPL